MEPGLLYTQDLLINLRFPNLVDDALFLFLLNLVLQFFLHFLLPGLELLY